MDTSARRSVGWCHSCGALQLKDEMPTRVLPWADRPEPVCLEDPGEPWGLGVWPKGDHDPACPIVELARIRTVDWTPTLAECTCGPAGNGQSTA